MAVLQSSLQNEFYLHQLYSLWFWQDGATAHTAQTSMAVLGYMFPGSLISLSQGQLVTCLPDLLAPHYFLWGMSKARCMRQIHWVVDLRPASVLTGRS
jgi:hypothetical protein